MAQIHLGPPLSGFRVFHSLPDGGAWSAARMYPSTGQVVLQMGVNGPQEHPEGIGCAAGFRRTITAEVGGIYSFSVSVQPGPITILPRGAHTIFSSVGLYLSALGFDEQDEWRFPDDRVVGAHYQPRTLMISGELIKGRTYELTLANVIHMDYSGVPSPAPYTEIIATYRSLVEMTPRLPLEAPEAAPNDRVARLLSGKNVREQEVSDQEMGTPEGIELK